MYEVTHADELRNAAGFVPSEQERYEHVRQIFERHCRVLDRARSTCLPLDQRPVDFVREQLEEVAKNGPIRGVVIDTLGTLVKQFSPVGDENSDERIRDLIGSFASEAREQIADRFQCSVWLLHDLNDVAHYRSPVARQSHLFAADCNHFGRDLDVCVAIGNLDCITGVFLIHRSKSPLEEKFA